MDRRKWTFKYLGDDTVSPDEYDGIFIEGIGGLYCRLDYIPISGPIGPTTWNEYDAYSLDCFTLNGEWIIGDNCELGTIVQRSKQNSKFTIHVDQANDVLQFQSDFTFTSGTIVKIYDIQGRIVFTRLIHASTTRISYPANLHGIYLVEVRNELINYHQKILIR